MRIKRLAQRHYCHDCRYQKVHTGDFTIELPCVYPLVHDSCSSADINCDNYGYDDNNDNNNHNDNDNSNDDNGE